MMRTLCGVIAVLLSVTSVCQLASLTCEKLLKPVDKGPDLSGRWYFIAISSDRCLAPIFFVLRPSIAVNMTPTDIPNIYDFSLDIKIFGYCHNESSSVFYGNNSVFQTDDNNVPIDEPLVLLPSGCPDCFVARQNDTMHNLMLLSKRKNVTAAELKEFETQADCLGWYKPQVLNSDHECGDEAPGLELIDTINQRLESKTELLECLSEKLNSN